jgi:hypothetical protein
MIVFMRVCGIGRISLGARIRIRFADRSRQLQHPPSEILYLSGSNHILPITALDRFSVRG